MDEESKTNLFLLYFVGLTIFSFLKTDLIADAMRTSPLPTALFIHIITNPAYLLIVFGVTAWRRDRMMRAFLAGIILVVAIDIISLPKLGSALPTITTEAFTNIDAVFAQAALNAGISYPLFRFAYYIIIPLLLLYTSLRLLGMKAFWHKVKGMGN